MRTSENPLKANFAELTFQRLSGKYLEYRFGSESYRYSEAGKVEIGAFWPLWRSHVRASGTLQTVSLGRTVNKVMWVGRNPKAPARRCRTLPLTPPRGEEALRRDDEGERLAGRRIHQLLWGSGAGYQLVLQPLPGAPSYGLRPR